MIEPTSIDAATRSPMIAPAATMISEPSMPIVYRLSRSRANGNGPKGISLGIAQPASGLMPPTRSRHRATTAPRRAAPNSDRAFTTASPPALCMLESVSAVAMPEGKGSWSMLISCRLSGIAMNTPSMESATSQRPISHHSSKRPVVR